MAIRRANAEWSGDLKNGKGEMALESGAFSGAYSFASRFEDGTGTNPEELIGAALAGCFSMALSHMLAESGATPKNVATTARVTLDQVGDDFAITGIELETKADVPGISDDQFQKHAHNAKKNCPVSKALGGTEIKLNACLTNA